ncbi:hypothetical protein E6C76_01410 [Pseudothauera nasutitermitis]|uniref:Uncharacterized protein n=1 Tax=Pseudothauera nasutitermitis TaxID=2565930 RepID=A0A4V3WCG2_9RHOO|nr:hypothetical protein [Pseudothauera nasutitermitis]THF67074.1 hypothetical protein E6C76_01410 [Pseudothauera nasutitermitis]
MTNYRNVEADAARSILYMTRHKRHSTFINRARKYINRLSLTEEEVLTVAENRLRFATTPPSILEKALKEFRRMLGTLRPDVVEASGQELQLLMALAGEKEDGSIVPNQPYEVAYDYYKQLYLRATERPRHGKACMTSQNPLC